MPVHPNRKTTNSTDILQVRRLFSLLLSICITLSVSSAQFSPGKLSSPHKYLKGNRNCNKCHSKGKVVDTQDCLDCHKPIRSRIKAVRGYHGRLDDQNCVRCHSEHYGRSYQMIYWEKGQENFDHNLTGYKLVDKHATLTCRQCHKADLIIAEDVKQWETDQRPDRFLIETFLGLGTECNDCHKDVHDRKFKEHCSTCHDQSNWHNAETGFDHAKTHFNLKGSHATVKCSDCHYVSVKGDSLDLSFSLAKGDKCQNCHEDVHKGNLKDNCLECHDETKWAAAQKKFDHSNSKFPLETAHRALTCNSCHFVDKKEGQTDLTFTLARGDKCTRCHEDIHHDAYGQNCTNCHEVIKWKETKTFDHTSTKFPLKGRHRKIQCAKCHKKEDAPKLRYDWCGRCHEDQHAGQFTDNNGWMDCARCHSTNDWKPSLFNFTQHTETHFPLEGAHGAVPCFLCHKADEELNGKIRYALGESTCSNCHEDQHNGQFNDKRSPPDCKSCHQMSGWKISAFDHRKTEFPLDGKHQKVPCRNCHKPATVYDMKTGNKREIIRYKPLAHNCIDCHRREFETP